MSLTAVGDTDLLPLDVIERAELRERFLDEGRVELAGERMVQTSAARATVWVVFTRHRLTCLGGVDPAQCGCASDADQFHAYQVRPDTPGALPMRPDLPLDPANEGPRQCKDCPPASRRPAPYPGPRCRTHHRLRRKHKSEERHRGQVRRNFGLVGDEYGRLLQSQGGRCAICRIADGSTKRLAVDHCHETGEVRGLLCAPCNNYLARIKNSPEAYARGLAYLLDPPARAVLPMRDEVDSPPLTDKERAEAAATVAEQVAGEPRGYAMLASLA